LVTFSLFWDLSHSVSTTILAGSGKLKRISQFFLVEAVLNLGLTLVLVRQRGIIGVALATAIASCATVVLLQIPYACRQFQVSIGTYLRKVWLPQFIPAIVTVVLLVAASRGNQLTAIAGGLLAVAAYGVVFWFFGTSFDDRASVRSVFGTTNT